MADIDRRFCLPRNPGHGTIWLMGKRKKKQKLVQLIRITFDDGTVGIFEGEAVRWPDDKKKITNFEWSVPGPIVNSNN